MADITMCTGAGCEDKASCYRYTALPTPMRQSFFAAPPGTNRDCDYFWKNNSEKLNETRLRSKHDTASLQGN